MILRDLAREPGSLPLLSHALLETWQRRTGRTLTLAGYHESGGVRGAIAHTAETVWTEALGETQRSAARRIFLRLTELGEGTEDTRRRVARTELALGANADEVDDVLRLLADRRLITVDDDTVEVAHEALIREWPRLRTWLDDDREGLRTHRHLTHAAEDWNSLGRDPGELYRSQRLQATREWLARDPAAQLNELETAFVDASGEQERAALAAEEERAAARERANRRLRVLLATAAAALVIALIAGAIAFTQRSNADRQARRARATSISAEVDRAVAEVPRLLERDRSLALLLAVQAQRIRADAATNGALFAGLVSEPRLRSTLWDGHGAYSWLAPFPGGARVAVLGREGGDVWDLAARKKVGGFEVPPQAAGLSVSSDGSLIAAGSRSGAVGFWDAHTLQPVGERIDAGAPITALAFLPDGKRLAVAVGAVESRDAITPETTARLWDVSTRRPSGIALAGHDQSVNTFAVSPDGKLLAAGDNQGRVVFHNLSDGTVVGRSLQLGGGEGIYDLAFSPNGRWLGVGTFARGGAGHAHAFDMVAREEVAQVGTASLMTVAFTADNKQFVTAGESVDVWNTANWQAARTRPIATQHGPPRAMSTDAGLVLSGFDGTLTVWDPNGLPTIARVLLGAASTGGTFSPDGAWLAITSSDDTMVLYRAHELSRVRMLSISGAGTRGLLDATTPVAFSPDSRVLAIGDRLGNVQLYDTSTQRATGPTIKTGDTAVVVLAFSPDGRSLVATSNSDTASGAHVIDVASRRVRSLDPPVPYALAATFRADGKELVVTIGVGGAVRYPVSGGDIGRGAVLNVTGAAPETAAFSPDGKLLAIGRTDGTLSFLDAQSMEQVGSSVPVSSGLLATATWSSDGALVVVQDVNSNNHLIDVGQRARIGDPLPGLGPARFGLGSFAPDGRTMVLPGPRGTTIWNLDVAQWPAKACTIAGRELTPAEWDTYFSASGAYRRTCAG